MLERFKFDIQSITPSQNELLRDLYFLATREEQVHICKWNMTYVKFEKNKNTIYTQFLIRDKDGTLKFKVPTDGKGGLDSLRKVNKRTFDSLVTRGVLICLNGDVNSDKILKFGISEQYKQIMYDYLLKYEHPLADTSAIKNLL